MSDAVAKLIPLVDVEDDQIDSRRQLRLYEDEPLVVGRNNVTYIEIPEVSRELLKLEWKGNCLYATPLKSEHLMRVGKECFGNETRVLETGTIISLLNDRCAYQIRYTQRTTSSRLSTQAKRKLTDHLACPICMEILVEAVMLQPCVHRFCKGCVANINCCPTCQARVNNVCPDRFVDQLVGELVQERCLDDDDAVVHMQRTGKDFNAPPPVKSTPKRRRRNQVPGAITSNSDNPIILT